MKISLKFANDLKKIRRRIAATFGLGFALVLGVGMLSKANAAPSILDGIYSFDIIQQGKTVGSVYAFPACGRADLKDYVWVYFKTFRATINGVVQPVTLKPMSPERTLPSSAGELIRSLNPADLSRVERSRVGVVPTEDVGGDSGGIIDIGDCPGGP